MRCTFVSANRIINFIKRERIYIFLLIFVILAHISFSLSTWLLHDSGLDKIFEQEKLREEALIFNEKITEAITSNPFLFFIFSLLIIGIILFAVGGVIIDIMYLYLSRKKENPIRQTQVIGKSRWDFWDICKVAIIFFFAQYVLWFANIFMFAGISALNAKEGLMLVLSTTLADITAIAAVIYFVLTERKQSIASLGLTVKRFFSNIKYGVFAYIGLIPILLSVVFLTTAIFKIFNIPVEPQPILVILERENDVFTLIYMGFFTMFLGPILEEIFFRGFAYTVFRKRLGILGGIVLSAAFFAYLHSNLAGFFPIFCLGMLLAYIYEKTGSLISAITVHIIHNSATFAFLLFLKGAAA